jgi:hypothetical protein
MMAESSDKSETDSMATFYAMESGGKHQ